MNYKDVSFLCELMNAIKRRDLLAEAIRYGELQVHVNWSLHIKFVICLPPPLPLILLMVGNEFQEQSTTLQTHTEHHTDPANTRSDSITHTQRQHMSLPAPFNTCSDSDISSLSLQSSQGQFSRDVSGDSRAKGTPTQDRKTGTHEVHVQRPFKPTSGADREPVHFTVDGEKSVVTTPTSRMVLTTLHPTSPDRHKIQRQEGHGSAPEPGYTHNIYQIQHQKSHNSTRSAPPSIEAESHQPITLPQSFQSGQGQYSREVSRDSSSLDSLENQKTFRLKPSLHLGKSTTLSITSPYFKRLQNEGYRRAEVTVDLGRELENVGTYWFLLPGQTTIQAIEKALDEACLKGYKKAGLNFKFQRLPDSELSSSMETPTIADWERLNPVSCTSILRLVELRVLNACRSGLKNVTYYYGIGGFNQEYEEELYEDSGSEFLTIFADTCCSGDRYSAELRFVFYGASEKRSISVYSCACKCVHLRLGALPFIHPGLFYTFPGSKVKWFTVVYNGKQRYAA